VSGGLQACKMASDSTGANICVTMAKGAVPLGRKLRWGQDVGNEKEALFDR